MRKHNSLFLDSTLIRSYYSQGSLVAASWIVTSSSCSVADKSQVAPGKVNVVLGEETLGQSSSYFKVKLHDVVFLSCYIYSQVSGVSDIITNNNIALWKLSAPVSLDTYTRICLPAQVSGVDTVRESDLC